MLMSSQMLQRLRNSDNDFYRMLSDAKGECTDLLAQVQRESFHTQALESLAERVGKAVNAVSVRLDRFALDLIEASTNLLRREFAVIEKGNEICDGPLEVDVVLPERVICIDQQRLRSSVLAWG